MPQRNTKNMNAEMLMMVISTLDGGIIVVIYFFEFSVLTTIKQKLFL